MHAFILEISVFIQKFISTVNGFLGQFKHETLGLHLSYLIDY